jgi:HSP20 family molecular chaperone IbpA
MAAAKKNQQTPPAAATADPKFEWAEKTGSYVLRLPLPGFRKQDFRVQIDGTGRLTVRGTRTGATGPCSLLKVFQLPSASSLDDIAGRFEAGVLTLTVPKRAGGAGVAKEEENKLAGSDREAKEEISKEDVFNKSVDEATNKTQQNKQQEEDDSRHKKEQDKPAPTPVKKEEDVKPAPLPEAANRTDKEKAAISPESLAERVRRRVEEEHANDATMGAAKRPKIDGEKKATAACGGWKERMAVDLKVLTDMKWADGVVDAARKNKEVVAVGIAAFALVGFLVSQKLFRK